MISTTGLPIHFFHRQDIITQSHFPSSSVQLTNRNQMRLLYITILSCPYSIKIWPTFIRFIINIYSICQINIIFTFF